MSSSLSPSYTYKNVDVTFGSDDKNGIGVILCSDVLGPDGTPLDDEHYAPDDIVVDLNGKKLIGIYADQEAIISELSGDNVKLIEELMRQGRSELCMLHGRVVNGEIVPSSKWKVDLAVR